MPFVLPRRRNAVDPKDASLSRSCGELTDPSDAGCEIGLSVRKPSKRAVLASRVQHD